MIQEKELTEQDIVKLIKDNYHEFGVEDIRLSLAEYGYTFTEADSMIEEALYGNRKKAKSQQKAIAITGSIAVSLGILITLVSVLKDFNSNPSTGPHNSNPASVKEAMAAYDSGDYEKAVKLLHPFAEGGDSSAQMLLGSLYDNGAGVGNYDHAEAAKWYALAAEQGNVQAQALLGDMYAKGRGVEQNAAEAAKWYHKAAELGSVESQVELAEMYEKGEGLKPDMKQAAKWYAKAAEHGNVDAQTAMGLMYINGQGVNQNFPKAAHWCLKAAQQGSVKSQSVLGVLYSTGQGVTKNLTESYKWFAMAAAGGNPAAKEEMKRLERQLTPDQIETARASVSRSVDPEEIASHP